ncbi:MAG: hypothetical protein AB3N20_18315 [Rhizobiaceae bacterium]
MSGSGTQNPVVVLTLRRTGGTSMMMLLQSCSSFPSLEHEPLNIDRSLGHITKAFVENTDNARLDEALGNALSERPNLKHCVETVPAPVTTALIRNCTRLNYRFLLWRRESMVNRIISLFVAKQTTIWGNQGRQAFADEIAKGNKILFPFDLAEMEEQARKDHHAWQLMVSSLDDLGVSGVEFSYEYLYEEPYKRKRAAELLEKLGFDLSSAGENIRVFAENRPERPSSLTEAVPNVKEAREFLRSLESRL